MMPNKLIIYDERVLAESIIQNGYTDREFIFWEAVLVAKYFRHVMGLGDSKTKTELENFTEQTADYFYKDNKNIKKKIKRILKLSVHDFKAIQPVYITKSELEKIRNIKNFKYQKIALGLLFLSKINNGWVADYKKKSLKAILSQNVYKKDIHLTIAYMVRLGMCIVSGTTKLTFIDNDSDIVFSINNDKIARNLGNMYVRHCGGELAWCKNCGKEFMKTGKNHRFCEECSKEIQLINHRKRNKKYYEKNSDAF